MLKKSLDPCAAIKQRHQKLLSPLERSKTIYKAKHSPHYNKMYVINVAEVINYHRCVHSFVCLQYTAIS